MKSLKYSFLLGLLCIGVASLAQATLSAPSTFTNQEIGNQDPDTVLAFFQDQFDMPDATTCFRGDADESGNITGTFDLDGGGTITFTNTSDNAVSVTFDLTGTGHVICGFEIFGGGSANFYTVSADEGVVNDGSSNPFIIHTPENNGGQLPAISHIQVFCCPAGAPDSGTTAMLLGGALAGVGLMRRYLKR